MRRRARTVECQATCHRNLVTPDSENRYSALSFSLIRTMEQSSRIIVLASMGLGGRNVLLSHEWNVAVCMWCPTRSARNEMKYLHLLRGSRSMNSALSARNRGLSQTKPLILLRSHELLFCQSHNTFNNAAHHAYHRRLYEIALGRSARGGSVHRPSFEVSAQPDESICNAQSKCL